MNICIPGYHLYHTALRMPIFFENEGWYLLFLLSAFLAPFFMVLCILHNFRVKNGETNEQIFALETITNAWINDQKVMVTFFLFLCWFVLIRAFHLLTFLYAISAGLTLHELYQPDKYRYLFQESHAVINKFVYKNQNNHGLIKNWWRFIKQRFQYEQIN